MITWLTEAMVYLTQPCLWIGTCMNLTIILIDFSYPRQQPRFHLPFLVHPCAKLSFSWQQLLTASRVWLSAGPGDFLLSPAGCPTSAFYVIVIDYSFSQSKGVKVITSTIPMKTPKFAAMKNVNYLPNVLCKMEAEKKDCFASIWVDEEGYTAEGPNVNVAFISEDKELMLPSFDKIPSGCTAKRLLALAPMLVEKGLLKSVGTCILTVAEQVKAASEIMYVDSGLPIVPIIMWDGQPVGDVKVGEVTMALSDLLLEDMTVGPETQRIPVPYTRGMLLFLAEEIS